MLHVKTLHLSIIVILATSLVIVSNNAFADNLIKSTSIDGTITPTGCHFVNGTVTQAIDIQNMTVQICNYNNKHFKLTDESDCVPFSMEENNCNVPVTCDANSSYVRGVTHGDNIPRYGRFVGQTITTIYPGNMCVSEAYNEQEKKITLIANSSGVIDHYPRCCAYVNYSQIDVLIPKDMLGNIAFTVDGNHLDGVPKIGPWLRPNQSDIEIDLPLSFITKKIEITILPENPVQNPTMLINASAVVAVHVDLANKPQTYEKDPCCDLVIKAEVDNPIDASGTITDPNGIIKPMTKILLENGKVQLDFNVTQSDPSGKYVVLVKVVKGPQTSDLSIQTEELNREKYITPLASHPALNQPSISWCTGCISPNQLQTNGIVIPLVVAAAVIGICFFLFRHFKD